MITIGIKKTFFACVTDWPINSRSVSRIADLDSIMKSFQEKMSTLYPSSSWFLLIECWQRIRILSRCRKCNEFTYRSVGINPDINWLDQQRWVGLGWVMKGAWLQWHMYSNCFDPLKNVGVCMQGPISSGLSISKYTFEIFSLGPLPMIIIGMIMALMNL